MGKKKKRERKQKKEDIVFRNPKSNRIDFDDVLMNINAKNRSKLSRKMKKKARREMLRMERDKTKDTKTSSGWHQVTVELKEKVDKNFILSSIQNYVDTPFVVLGFHKIGTNVCFYFEFNKNIGEAIKGLDRRIQAPDGEAMRINVSAIEVPELVLNSNQLLVLNEVISSRYDSTLGLLDLTCLHRDKNLLEKDIFVPLSNPLIMKQVLRIITENISNLNALNLCKNKLDNSSLQLLQSLYANNCTLSALNLEENNINNLQFVKFINMFPLRELQFSSNPVQKTIKNPLQHLKMLRKELPSLKMVDGVDVDSFPGIVSSPTTSQILRSDTSLLTEECVRTFLDQYYKVVDTTDRPKLCVAYTPNASITLQSLNPAIPSRIYNGQEEIQSFLSSFPSTKHLHDSFNLEILGIGPTEGCIKITGMFQVDEIPLSLNFERSMKIVPYNTGFCCALDSFTVR